MKKNKINIVFSVILSGLLIYFLYLIRTIYPFVIDNSIFVCKSCLNSIPLFVQKIIIVLLLVAFGNLLLNYIKNTLFKHSLHFVNLKPKSVISLEKKYFLHKKIIIFRNQKLLAFCMGILKPKIFISSEVLKRMTYREIEAIILHERQHIIGKDNLVMIFLNLVKTSFFFFPVVTDFVNNLEIQREIKADQSVVKETGRKINIISALRKIIESKPNYVYANAFSESFSIEPRVHSLIGKGSNLFPFKYGSIVISLSVLLFLMNLTLSRIEIHPQTNSSTMLCIDKGTCQNSCQ